MTTLTWGDKGPIIFFAVNETACLFFLEEPSIVPDCAMVKLVFP